MAETITTCKMKVDVAGENVVTASDRPMVIDDLIEGDVVKLSVTVNGKQSDIMSETFTVPKMKAVGNYGRFAVHLTTYDEIAPAPVIKEGQIEE